MQAARLADTNKMWNRVVCSLNMSGIVFHFISERKRRRWDQQASGDETPAKKKSSSWDQAEVGKLASQRRQPFFPQDISMSTGFMSLRQYINQRQLNSCTVYEPSNQSLVSFESNKCSHFFLR